MVCTLPYWLLKPKLYPNPKPFTQLTVLLINFSTIMQTILITGGTGLVGNVLCKQLLSNGYKVIVLTRKARQSTITNLAYRLWDVDAQYIDPTAIQQANHIIHLAGASVAEKRWTAKRKDEILNSRINSGKLLAHAIKTIPNNIETVVSASAQGWYGADAGTIFTETMPAHNDFLGDTCQKWEQSVQPIQSLGKRLVVLRIGIVLSTKGGALKEFLKPLAFRLATILGNGKQVISWIHINDLCAMFMHAINNKAVMGIYNACATNPVSNKELIKTAAAIKFKKWYLPVYVPSFILKLVLGQMSIELLKSTTMDNSKIKQTGFNFSFSHIKQALENLLQAK
jgi:uncharacterized protein